MSSNQLRIGLKARKVTEEARKSSIAGIGSALHEPYDHRSKRTFASRLK
jgi:hypothetical protein